MARTHPRPEATVQRHLAPCCDHCWVCGRALWITDTNQRTVATLAGLFGGLVVSITVLGLSPTAFFQRLTDNVGISHFWVGMSKAPIMAVVIAGYGTFDATTTQGNVYGMTSDYVTAGRTPDGNLVMAYLPSLRTVTVDMTQLRAPATADPTTPPVATAPPEATPEPAAQPDATPAPDATAEAAADPATTPAATP